MAVASKNVLKWLYATLTQSGADAFIQASISTPFGVDRTVGIIRELWVAWPRGSQAVGSIIREFYLTTKSFAAVPVLGTDRSLLWGAKRYIEEASAVGSNIDLDGLQRVQFQDDFAPLIVEATLYAQFDTTATTLTNVAYCKIGYEESTMNDADRFALQAARLAS